MPMLTMPSPVAIPLLENTPLVKYEALNICADNCRKADAIIERAFGKPQRTPHGFYQPGAFVASCNDGAARNRLRKVLIARLNARAVLSGKLSLSVGSKGELEYGLPQ